MKTRPHHPSCPVSEADPFQLSAFSFQLSHRAFTLIELLTVIAIIGILAGIIIPVTGKVRETARAAQCTSNLRSLQQAAIMAIENNRGKMLDRSRWPLSGTANSIIPYLSLPKDATGSDDPWPANAPSPLRCEAANRLNLSTKGYGRTYGINHYACATNNGTALTDTAKTIDDIATPSQMAFFLDGAPQSAGTDYWYYVRDNNIRNPDTNPPPNYPHKGDINIAYLDGHIRRISKAVMEADHKQSSSPLWKGSLK